MPERVRVKLWNSRPRPDRLRDLPDSMALHPLHDHLPALRLESRDEERLGADRARPLASEVVGQDSLCYLGQRHRGLNPALALDPPKAQVPCDIAHVEGDDLGAPESAVAHAPRGLCRVDPYIP